MSDVSTASPLLLITFQINENNAGCIEIYRLEDIDKRINEFCKGYNIFDLLSITRIKNRAYKTINYPCEANFDKIEPYKERGSKKQASCKSSLSFKRGYQNSKNKIGIKGIMGNIHLNGANTRPCINNPLIPKMIQPFYLKSKPQKIVKHENYSTKNIFQNMRTKTAQRKSNISISSNILIKDIRIPKNQKNQLYNIGYAFKSPFVMEDNTECRDTLKIDTDERFTDEASITSFPSPILKNLNLYSPARSQFKTDTNDERNNKDNCSHASKETSEKFRNLIVEIEGNKRGYYTDMDTQKSDTNFYMTKKLRALFEQLDSNGSGLIGPRNLNLRAITTSNLQLFETVIAELFKDGDNNYYTFADFSDLVDRHRIFF